MTERGFVRGPATSQRSRRRGRPTAPRRFSEIDDVAWAWPALGVILARRVWAGACILDSTMRVEDLFYLPDGPQMLRVIVRVLAAAALGALLGAERERAGKPAGLRTHMLVA